MLRLAFDIETDGFLEDVSRIHCIVIKDIDTGNVYRYGPEEVQAALVDLMEADLIIGHNIIEYDLPVILKLYPWFDFDPAKVRDTLTLSRLVYSNLSDSDQADRALYEALKPVKLLGSHSLKAWGIRFKVLKLSHEDWTEYSEEMLERCVVDVEITERLWIDIESNNVDPRASELEHSVQFIVARQSRYGFMFDVDAALKLNAKLLSRRAELEQELQDTFKPWYRLQEEVEPKRTINYKDKPGTWAGAKYSKIKLTTFNPSSRFHIADRLKALYGWKPTEINDDGSAKIDETVLGKLSYPEAKLIAEYMTVQKRISMLSEGEGAWLNYVQADGRIHGQIITNGAVTGRATHRSPNMSQVPAVTALYGKECRRLFRVPDTAIQVGADCSGLELRMLAHYLAKHDGGAYARVVTEGDVHWTNAIALGLTSAPTIDKTNKTHDLIRRVIKTFIYAFLYGAGDLKIGQTLFELVLMLRVNKLDEQWVLDLFFDGKANPSETILRKAGKKAKATFTDKTPGLKQLVEGVKKSAEQRGYLIGLDGRRLHIRSSHAALNTLLQSAGALVCKRWMVEVDTHLIDYRYEQIAWSHDEIQFELMDPEIADEFGKQVVECIGYAQEYFNIRCPLTGEYKVGRNWAETH